MLFSEKAQSSLQQEYKLNGIQEEKNIARAAWIYLAYRFLGQYE
jgi:hypothetical protein